MPDHTSTKPRWEVADVVRLFGKSYQEQHGLPASHRQVLQSIANCRTAALGGHLEECDSCGHRRPAYNSCGNRHCPKCGAMAKDAWLEARTADLLPVPYFHQVFTLPHELNGLTLVNMKVVLGLLFKAVSDTLLDFGKGSGDDREGGRAGFTLVLHTWDQQLRAHFHLHCVIPAGALSRDGTRWIPAGSAAYLFNVGNLGLVFREKFLALLEAAFDKDRLVFPGQLEPLAAPHIFAEEMLRLRAKKWVVYSKAPFGGPKQVLDYLGRYTHRTAISNHRIVDVSAAGVTFSYRDRKNGNAQKTMTVPGHEFLRRFLLHVLPRGLQRIRHYGFLAARAKGEELPKCRAALGAAPPPTKPEPLTAVERLLKATGIDVLKCPCCEVGRMRRGEVLVPARPTRRMPTFADVFDSS